MKPLYYEGFPQEIIENGRNALVLGPGGSGKSWLIKELLKLESGIILTAPSGVAAKNIGGTTIQSFFGIIPNTYVFTNQNIVNKDRISRIKSARFLLIDEVSMLRCEILDLVDSKARVIRNDHRPFGGLQLIFLGDTCQMEPVTQDFEEEHMGKYYPGTFGDYHFYNAKVMRAGSYFDATFDIYRLEHDFRHKDDPAFAEMLLEVRLGKAPAGVLDKLNGQVKELFYDESIQYLTSTNYMAAMINNQFLKKLSGRSFFVVPEVEKTEHYTDEAFKMLRTPLKNPLIMREGMKIMFIKNDSAENGSRWVNGTLGKIEKIYGGGAGVLSVDVSIGNNVHTVFKEDHSQKYQVRDEWGHSIKDIAAIRQFPFRAAYAITIDKSQGLTLDKVYVFLGDKVRDNQLYVALSRVQCLSNIWLSRKIQGGDIRLSKAMDMFNRAIEGKVIPVHYRETVSATVVNINYGTQVFNGDVVGITA